MEVLRKALLRTWISPHLSVGSRGPELTVDLLEVVETILYKLKTGCQWRQLLLKQFFTRAALLWEGVYYPFKEWRNDGSWKRLWVTLVGQHKPRLDLSSVQPDGRHAHTHHGGAAIGYQGRKAARTTTLLFLADNAGQPLACATSQAGNPYDLFDSTTSFGEVCAVLEEAHSTRDGLFLNADSGFDASSLRDECFRRGMEANIAHNPRAGAGGAPDDQYFDDELYRQRTAIERTNAWLDGFTTLLVRYEARVDSWLAFHFLAFAVLLLRKIAPEAKP